MNAMRSSQPDVADGERRLVRTTRATAAKRAAATLCFFLAVGIAATWFASCSYIAPEVGKFRGACHGGGGYARPDAYAPGESDPRCTPAEDDDACAICEDAHCCGTRFGCYDDVACACADEEFDECLEDVADPTSPEGVEATAHCWDEFSGSGIHAKARVDCQRAFCKEGCGVP